MQGIENVPAVHQKIEIKGTCSKRFEAVREAFKHNLDTAQDVGASVAIFVDGEPIVDLWGGHTTVGAATFGTITTAGDPRVIQLAVKFFF